MSTFPTQQSHPSFLISNMTHFSAQSLTLCSPQGAFVIYFPLDLSMGYKEGQGAMMTTTASTTLPCPTMIKAVVERTCSSCSLLSLVLVFLVLRYYVASGENFKAKGWEKVCRRQFLFNKLSTRMYKFTRIYNFFKTALQRLHQ
jgi:hypothetical protein